MMLGYMNTVHDLCMLNHHISSRSEKMAFCTMKCSSPKVIKLFFALSSAEYEICPANKSQITNNCKFFLNIGGHDNFSANEHENAN